ncbi:MAG: alkaline phosphatase [Spirochaetes bacterium]|nr:alkaline phosphatase [Spirochaetota bacterium]
MRTRIRSFAAILLIAFAATGAFAQAKAPTEVKNVIFLLTDGTGPEAWPLIRWVKGSPLAVDSILTGAIRTYGADSIITDSAPGATAFATGYKGTDKGISVGAWNVTVEASRNRLASSYVPLATLVEGARISGRATGIVATSNVQHATPAAFSAHWHDRNNYNELAEQQVYQGMDVVLSGGSQYLVLKDAGGKREDKEDLVDVIKAKGYAWVTTKDEMAAVRAGKVWGAFAPDAMAYDIDRDELAASEPSLAEMTGKAIELLSASQKAKSKGFFLFVEGSKVDWAAHANDPAGLVSDLLAFDDAVRVALEYAKKDPNTLVVAVADHGTGGITIGTREDPNYSSTDDDFVVGPMRRTGMTAEGLEKYLAGDASEEKIKAVMAGKWGIADLSADELKAIVDVTTAKKPLTPVIVPMLSKRARLGWTTSGHTGADVLMFAYGPAKPAGLMENTDVGKAVAEAMGFYFPSLNTRLFSEADRSFRAEGFEVAIDRTDPANLALVVTRNGKSARFPFAKNVMIVGDKVTELEGLVVYAEKLGRVFLPSQAITLAAAALK